MTLDELKELLETGQFHHATYREIGNLCEGLYIYVKEDNRFNGFTLHGCFPKNHPDGEKAYDMVRHTGVSVGSRGRG